MSALTAILPPGSANSNGRRPAAIYTLLDSRKRSFRYEITRDDKSVARSSRLATVCEAFESNLRLLVAELAPRRVFIHAGVVARNGYAIILPGKSFSGKTTLVKELIRAGAVYYSDEYAVLDFGGRVHPFLRPLEVRSDGTGKQHKVKPESFGATVGSRALPVGLIVISRYSAGTNWKPRLLSAGRGALELLRHTVPARRNPQGALEVIQRIVSKATIVRSSRGEARETAATILKYFDDLCTDN